MVRQKSFIVLENSGSDLNIQDNFRNYEYSSDNSITIVNGVSSSANLTFSTGGSDILSRTL